MILGGGIVSDDVEEEGEDVEDEDDDDDDKVEEDGAEEDEAVEDSASGTAARHAPKSTIQEGCFLTDGIRVVGATAAP